MYFQKCAISISLSPHVLYFLNAFSYSSESTDFLFWGPFYIPLKKKHPKEHFVYMGYTY